MANNGVYTLRVYLMRSAARRDETSDYTLTIHIEGKALKQTPNDKDAILPGTSFHASTQSSCIPPFTHDAKVQMCEAFVIRRGFDGTATIENHPSPGVKRSSLFLRGKPETADSHETLTFTRSDDFTIVNFGDTEKYEIPDALLNEG